MKLRALENLINELASRTASDLDIRNRGLREIGLVPVGGRGPHAPDLTPTHAANVTIASFGTRRAVEAASVVVDYSGLVCAEGSKQSPANTVTFHEALENILANPELANQVKQIIFAHEPREDECLMRTRRYPSAEIIWEKDGQLVEAHFVPQGDQAVVAEVGRWSKDCSIVSKELLVNIAARLKGGIFDDDVEACRTLGDC